MLYWYPKYAGYSLQSSRSCLDLLRSLLMNPPSIDRLETGLPEHATDDGQVPAGGPSASFYQASEYDGGTPSELPNRTWGFRRPSPTGKDTTSRSRRKRCVPFFLLLLPCSRYYNRIPALYLRPSAEVNHSRKDLIVVVYRSRVSHLKYTNQLGRVGIPN